MTGIYVRDCDCIVVGSGLVGMLTARGLQQAGARVVVIDRGAAGRESSWAGGGILSPLYPWRYPAAVTLLAARSQSIYPLLVRDLEQATGVDAEWVKSGLLVMDTRLDADIRAWANRYGYLVEPVSGDAVKAADPEIGLLHANNVLLPEVAQIRNPLLCTAMKEAICREGVRLLEHTAVTGLKLANDRVLGVSTDNGDIDAGRVVIACGAWSSQVLQQAGLALAVEPVRGQMVMFETPPGLLRRITLLGNHYLIPRRNGLVLFGSTLEHTGFRKETTQEARELLVQEAIRMAPVLKNYPVVRHWAGLRPGTADGIPFIGEHPEITGLFVNAGHFRNGVVMAPASAQLLVEQMLGRETFIPAAPYQLT